MRRGKPVIAVAAIRYFDVHKTHNVEKIIDFIRRARKAGADIVCFPESCVKRDRTLLLTDRFMEKIREACRENNIWCIITEDVRIKDKVYNMSVLIDRAGRLRGGYKKINLYGDRVAPGKQVKVFETDFGKIGMAICWDLTYPGLFAAMRRKGAEIVFCPAQWNYDLPSHKSRHKHWETILLRSMTLARAHENVMYVAICNPLMDEERQVSYSAIASPHRILKELIDEEGLITAQVDLAEIKEFRKMYEK